VIEFNEYNEYYEYDERLYLKKIIPIIKLKQGLLTAGDVALETSLPLIHIKFALGKLASKYIASVKATEDGGLIYDFGNKLKKARDFSGIFKNIFFGFLNTIKYLLKITIMLTLILYTLFFIFVIIALLIASIVFIIASIFTDDNNSNSSSSSKAVDLSGAFEALFGMLAVLGNITSFLGDDFDSGRGKNPFYVNVFSFVFGDDKGKSRFNHEKNILRFFKFFKNITLVEAINLTGLSEYKTRKILVDMAIKYDGDIKVNDDGVIIYVFNEVTFTAEIDFEENVDEFDYLYEDYVSLKERQMKKNRKNNEENNEDEYVYVNTGEEQDGEPYTYVWDRTIPLPKLNYNTGTENVYIISFNLFNLFMSIIGGFWLLEDLNSGLFSLFQDDRILVLFLFTYPFIFSVLFFAIPILRSFFLIFNTVKAEKINEFLLVLKLIFDSSENYLDISSINKNMRKKIFTNYPSLFVHDFIEEREIINIENYKSELLTKE